MAWVIIGCVMMALAIPALFIMEDAGAIELFFFGAMVVFIAEGARKKKQ